MADNDEILYAYALDEKGKIVSIEDLSIHSYGVKYRCPHCNGMLLPRALRNGAKKQKHFYHPPVLQDKAVLCCNGETYLHATVKRRLAEAIRNTHSFILRYSKRVDCCHPGAIKGVCFRVEHKVLNLAEAYPIVNIEKRDGDFIPDILLENSKGEKLYIEINVTSPASIKKISSQTKVIEIHIPDTEAMEKLLSESSIDEDDHRISLYGFEANHFFDCRGECEHAVVPAPTDAPSLFPEISSSSSKTSICPVPIPVPERIAREIRPFHNSQFGIRGSDRSEEFKILHPKRYIHKTTMLFAICKNAFYTIRREYDGYHLYIVDGSDVFEVCPQEKYPNSLEEVEILLTSSPSS